MEGRKELINDMLSMQRVLDSSIYSEHKVIFDKDKCKMALLDEIGEFTHELKGGFDDVEPWCWWKKTQKQSTRQKVLEEYVDILHFALSIHYHWLDWIGEDFQYKPMNVDSDFIESPFACMLTDLVNDDVNIIEKYFYIATKLGFSFYEIYYAYKAKNEENFRRLANNY